MHQGGCGLLDQKGQATLQAKVIERLPRLIVLMFPRIFLFFHSLHTCLCTRHSRRVLGQHVSPVDQMPNDVTNTNPLVEGVVVRSTGSWSHVKTAKGVVPSRASGRLRLRSHELTNPVAVGDRVRLRQVPDGTGSIMHVHRRGNYLGRRAAGRRVGRMQVLVSNVDAVWIIQSVALPKPNSGLLDRTLVAAESQDITAGIVFNKVDLPGDVAHRKVEKLRDRYSILGYPVFLTSVLTGEGVHGFRQELQDRVNIFAGPSGAGKSSLLNLMEPRLRLPVKPVSLKSRKGRHTTTYAELLWLTGGGAVVDTPGVREFGLINVPPESLGRCFPEFRRYLRDCRFRNCRHDREPGCRVKKAMTNRVIANQRYRSYLRILRSIEAGEADVGR